MRLQSLELNNFRGFPNVTQTLDLDHSVVLLYGRNGSGKTSICDALELLLTGSIRRFRAIDDLPNVLVNARNQKAAATLKLNAISDHHPTSVNTQIVTNKLVGFDRVLDSSNAALFRHTGYLQQSDIRELVTASSRQLGEIIRLLAVDEAVYMLEEALSNANITRNNRNYVAAVRAVDDLASQTQDISVRLAATNSTLQTIDLPDERIKEWRTTIARIANDLKIEPPRQLSTADSIQQAGEQLSSTLQQRLTDIANARTTLQRHLARCQELINIEKSYKAMGTAGRNLETGAREREKELERLNSNIEDLQVKIQQPELAGVTSDRRSRLIGALQEIGTFPDLQVCPVCDREFEDLNAHITTKIASLRAEQSALQQRAQDLRNEINQQLQTKEQLQREISDVRLRARAIQSDQEQYRQDVEALSIQYNKEAKDKPSLTEIRRRIFDQNSQLALEEQRLTAWMSNLDGIRSSISTVKLRRNELSNTIKSTTARLASVEQRLASARSAQRRVEEFIDNAQNVRRNISSAIENVISRFVLGHTKETFEELFRRLAKNPFFEVTISGARVKWHNPEVNWHAVYNDRHFPGAAVFSQGELNSCAIAFFLALAISHPGGLKFLMLDDPVQNMDEIHIEEFGNILKFLKDELGWQLLVSLHDESVFQFFKRQLHPTKEGQSLVAFQFEESDAGSRIIQESTASFDPKAFVAHVA